MPERGRDIYDSGSTDADSDPDTWAAGEAAADRLASVDVTGSWASQTPPAPGELARELEMKRGVVDATAGTDAVSGYVELTLAERHRTVPAHIARPIYRRGLAIADVTPIAGHAHRQVEVRPPEGRR
jgi:hypothetical protein